MVITYPALFNDEVERTDNFLHRNCSRRTQQSVQNVCLVFHTCVVRTVGEDHVDILESEAFQGLLSAFDDAMNVDGEKLCHRAIFLRIYLLLPG